MAFKEIAGAKFAERKAPGRGFPRSSRGKLAARSPRFRECGKSEKKTILERVGAVVACSIKLFCHNVVKNGKSCAPNQGV